MTKEKIRIKYYECNMTKGQHVLAYLIFVLIISTILFIYYHNIIVSAVGGAIIAVFQEKFYPMAVIKKRQNRLRVQFKEFLEIITISISGGSGRSMENAIKDSVRELKMMFNEKTDIVREIELIVNDYERVGVPMSQGFGELGNRSDVDDIKSFAAIYKTIDGKSSDFGYIIRQTHDIIRDKLEITQEVETVISSAKSEAYMMLVMPLIIVIAMSTMGSGFLDSLFTTWIGRAAATVGVVALGVSYVLATRAVDIEV